MAPEIRYVPPHDPVYQFQFEPVPRIPPDEFNVVAEPVHIVEGLADAELAAIETELTVTIVLTHEVELHIPSALT